MLEEVVDGLRRMAQASRKSMSPDGAEGTQILRDARLVRLALKHKERIFQTPEDRHKEHVAPL